MTSKGKTVLFFNEASSRIGIGHLLRSQNLAIEMSKRGYTVVGVTVGDQKAVLEAQKKALHGGFSWSINSVSNCEEAERLIHEIMPDLVVIDCTNLREEIIVFCHNQDLKSIALDYFDVTRLLPNAVINLIDHNPVAVQGGVPNRQGVQYVEGPEYAIIRDEFLNARKSRLDRAEPINLHHVVIAFGGADPSGNSRKAIEFLQSCSNRLYVDLIIGPLFIKELRETLETVGSKHNVNFHEAPDNMGGMFEKADLLFCGGGGTVLESLCVGVPTVVIAQNEPELRHARSLDSKGACWLYENVNWKSVNSQANRTRISQIAKATVDGAGTKRIGDIAENQLALN